MTEIRVTTTAEIVDSRGRHIATVINTATARPGDNARYYATFTRGAIQSTEQQITLALIAQFGDKPADNLARRPDVGHLCEYDDTDMCAWPGHRR